MSKADNIKALGALIITIFFIVSSIYVYSELVKGIEDPNYFENKARTECQNQEVTSGELYYKYDTFWEKCELHNSTKERIDREKAIALQKAREKCFNEGKWYNQSFDLITDYDLACAKIHYINDNIITESEKRSTGYVEGYSSGLFSSGHISGEFSQWVYTNSLAVGLLPKELKYHLDCNNKTINSVNQDTRDIKYYSHEDFVMYYVDKCIEEE